MQVILWSSDSIREKRMGDHPLNSRPYIQEGAQECTVMTQQITQLSKHMSKLMSKLMNKLMNKLMSKVITQHFSQLSKTISQHDSDRL